MIQNEGSAVAVLRLNLLLRVQQFHGLRGIAGFRVHRNGFRVFLRVHANLVLHGQVNQAVPVPAPDEVLRGNAPGVLGDGKLVDLFHPQDIEISPGVFLHGDRLDVLSRCRGG